ncbi:MAG: 6-phosphofructokinase [Chitinophagales bacterium]|nr:6-phosphofructokinase [Bacteroidota bacterium]MCB9257023.1 6-phosphofructokinase [Chitinophagales bacterium]
MSISKIAVFTSGGDSPGMNAALRAVVRSAIYYNLEVLGIYRGLEGLIEGDFVALDERSVARIINRGGTIIKSARSEEFRSYEGRKKAYQQLIDHKVDALIGIGGDGTFTGLHIFQEEFSFPVLGLPGTIDNDIFGTDYTIGFDTASNTAMEAIDKIRDTATSHNRLFFIEVMGRDAGFIALRCAIASGAKAVMLPETHMEPSELLNHIKKGAKQRKTSNIVIVSEGNKNGNASELAALIKELEPSYDTKVTVLGHIQRGGSPSAYDRLLASRLGVAGVEALLAGKQDIMVGIKNEKIAFTPLNKAIKEHHHLCDELLHVIDILSI